MSRPHETILLWIGGGLLGLILVLFVAGIAIVRTDWFRNMVRRKDRRRGGRREPADARRSAPSPSIGPTCARRSATFVLHGLEPADAAPLFRADLLQVDLKLLSPFHGFVDIAYLLVEKPQANIIVAADGHTNMPAPKVPGKGDKTALQTVVDLAIGKFDLRDGARHFADRKTPLNVRGENLRAAARLQSRDLALYRRGGRQPALRERPPRRREAAASHWRRTASRSPTPFCTRRNRRSRLRAPWSTWSRREPTPTSSRGWRWTKSGNWRHSAFRWTRRTVPPILNADITASMDDAGIQHSECERDLGQTTIQASGNTKQVQFQTALALGELGRLFRVAARPEGTARLDGTASYANANDYRVNANLDARNVAFRQGTTRIAGVGLSSAVSAEPAAASNSPGCVWMPSAALSPATLRSKNLDRFHVRGQPAQLRYRPTGAHASGQTAGL